MFTHRKAGGTVALAGGNVTHPSIHTQTRLQAAVAEETARAGLIAEEPRPPGLACAFTFHGVAAGQKNTDKYDETVLSFKARS